VVNSKRLVVAKYKEGIDWIYDLKDEFEIVVYNKDNDLSVDSLSFEKREYVVNGIKWIDLPNIGREAQTYLFHIIENYGNTRDLEFFTQGNPFDHSPDFLNKIRSIDTSSYYNNLCDERVIQKRSDFIESEKNKIHFYYGNQNTLHKELFGNEVPALYEIGLRGMFIASRKAIKDNSLDLYKNCYKKFDSNLYLTGFSYLDKVAGREVNTEDYSDVIERHGGIPNGENFPFVFEYFWDLLFKSQKTIEL